MTRMLWTALTAAITVLQGQTPPAPVSPVPPTRQTRWSGWTPVLRPGRNIIAVHVKQIRGGQLVDVGIVEVRDSR